MHAFKLCLMSAVVGVLLLSTGGDMRSAAAGEVRVVVDPPVFVPHDEFRYEDGYYRTHDGHYYHYDRDRAGWHYGRNHEEGVRYERSHHGERH